ncbi:DUF3566 domain-containing protein [Actinomycetaceae bacterium MB13-C1-2]|nr:DUF3566 domain-containing protein [Actinomycetaceae bacterium MB13-C1-2]
MSDQTVTSEDIGAPPPPSHEVEQTEYIEDQAGSFDYYVQEAQYLDEPRRSDVTIARIDAWSVLKTSFLISIAIGIATVVAAIVLWFLLDGMGVFGSMEDFLTELNAERFLGLLEYMRLPRVISYSTILGVANVVIFTAMSALAALLYNLIAALVGGIRVSLMDE